MKRIITTLMLSILMVGCVSKRLSDDGLIQAARHYVEANQKELTSPFSLGEYNPKYTKVEPAGQTCRVTLAYGSLSYDSLWLFNIEMSPSGDILKTTKEFQGIK